MSPSRMFLLVGALALAIACTPGAETTTEVATEATTPTATETETEAETATGTVDPQVLVDAADATTAEGSANIEIATLFSDGGQEQQGLTATGVVDFENGQRQLTFEGPQGELRMIIDGSMLYLEVPASEDEQWFALDLEELTGEQLDLTQPGALPTQDPRATVAFLRGATEDIQEVGTEDVRGDETTHYRAAIDLEQAAEQADPEVQQQLEATAQQAGSPNIDMDVWIDDEDRLRRVEYSFDLSEMDTGAATTAVSPSPEVDVDTDTTGTDTTGTDTTDTDTTGTDLGDTTTGTTGTGAMQGTATLRVEYYDFGTEVDIQLPEDDQIVELDEQQIRETFQQPGTGTTGTDTTVSPTPDIDTDTDTDTGTDVDISPAPEPGS